MTEADLPICYRIHRLAFGTEFGLPDPMKFRGDSDVVRVRFGMYPEGCLVAEVEGDVVAFGISSRWGSVGLLGPICVNPTHWNRGIARELTKHCVDLFDQWGCSASGLLTNPSSPRHLRLYQAFGYWPRYLTIVMARETDRAPPAVSAENLTETTRSRDDVIRDIRALTSAAYPGLDMTTEISAVFERKLGVVLFTYDGETLADFAICHSGPGSEGMSDILFVKFGLVRPGPEAHDRFARLIRNCVGHASRNGLARVIMGTNTGRHDAYRTLLSHGFRSEFQGVRMHRPMVDIFDTPSAYALDDWR
jgi:GNAT superfamily N-acetyltransferase